MTEHPEGLEARLREVLVEPGSAIQLSKKSARWLLDELTRLRADLAAAQQERGEAREGAQFYNRKAAEAIVRAEENVVSSPMASALLLKLKAECEAQHARAEAAEAKLAALEAENAQLRANLVATQDQVDGWSRCICDGGDQGDGLCAIPHEPHCPLFES